MVTEKTTVMTMGNRNGLLAYLPARICSGMDVTTITVDSGI